jgi:hypothetical protein
VEGRTEQHGKQSIVQQNCSPYDRKQREREKGAEGPNILSNSTPRFK